MQPLKGLSKKKFFTNYRLPDYKLLYLLDFGKEFHVHRSESLTCTFRASCCSARLSRAQVPAPLSGTRSPFTCTFGQAVIAHVCDLSWVLVLTWVSPFVQDNGIYVFDKNN